MKNVFFALIVFLGMSNNTLLGQSAYYDALELGKLAPTSNPQGVLIFGKSDGRNIKAAQILAKYIDSDNPSYDTIYKNFKDNPFFVLVEETAQASPRKFSGIQDAVSSLGGLNVTTFADGLAQFMMERANEEINVWFFRKFKEDLNESTELRIIFPVTNSFIQITEPYQYAQNLHLLREAFKKDLTEIIDNLENLANLEKYRRVMEASPELKMIWVGLTGASIVSNIKNGAHPAAVIDSLGQKKYLASLNNNLYSSLILFSTVSQSFRSQEDGIGHIPASDFKTDILANPTIFRIYLGLLFQQLKEVKYSNGPKTITIGEILSTPSIKETILGTPNLGLDILERLNTLELNFEILKKKTDTTAVKYLEWYDFYSSLIDLVEFGIERTNILPIKSTDLPATKIWESKKYIYSARLGNEIFKNVNEKNYSLAILNFSILYDTLIYGPTRRYQPKIDTEIARQIAELENDVQKAWYLLSAINDHFSIDSINRLTLEGELIDYSEFLLKYYGTDNIDKALDAFKKQSKEYSLSSSKFIKYGAFMAAVSDAEKPEDVKAALNAAALPAGSSSIKRQTPFNVAINSYLGFHHGEENLEGKGWGEIRGVSAPVGIAISTKVKFLFRESGSISFFGSIIDIGAVASFRLSNDEGVEELPEMKLENIIAPGAYVVYGVPKTPISIGYGWQRGPQLRGITTSTPVAGEPPLVSYDLANGYRWNFFVAVDIPLFNLYTRSR